MTRATDTNRLYAATQAGLLQTIDGGRTWAVAFTLKRPVTMVEVVPTGEVFAFVMGIGLVKAAEPALGWETLANPWGENYLLHLAADPTNPSTLYAVAGQGGIMASKDGGRTWASFGGGPNR